MESVRTVKEMNPEEQPREKADKYGVEYLTTIELWALILRTGSQGKPITELCRDLMERNDNSLHKLERRTKPELMELRGLGNMKCTQILAVLELIRRYSREANLPGEIITSSDQVYRRMRSYVANLPHEEIWLMLLNRRNEVMKEVRISVGSSTASIFDIKKILRTAILEYAEGIILIHNHPSGNLKSSAADDKITEELRESCRMMQITLLDHVIISPSGFFSYRDKGRL